MIQKAQVWVAVAALLFLISLPVSAQPGAANGSPLELWRSVLAFFTGEIVDFADGSSEIAIAEGQDSLTFVHNDASAEVSVPIDSPSQQPAANGAEAGPYIEPGG